MTMLAVLNHAVVLSVSSLSSLSVLDHVGGAPTMLVLIVCEVMKY